MIRKAVEGDISSVAAIYAAILEIEEKERKTGWLKGIYPIEETARAALGRDDLFVMEESGRILACAVINKIQVDVYADCEWSLSVPGDKVMVLHTLCVLPGENRRGLGTEFVRFYEDYAKACGCLTLRMDTNEINTRARAMYKKLGYREVGTVPCVFNGIPNVMLVCLEKNL